MQKRPFGKTANGEAVDLYLLKNKNNVEIGIINYGAHVVSLKVPDRQGKLADVVLGYDNLAGYEADKSHFGRIIGRYANRIAFGKFTLNGREYTPDRNNGQTICTAEIRPWLRPQLCAEGK